MPLGLGILAKIILTVSASAQMLPDQIESPRELPLPVSREELCIYDKDYCGRLVNTDGTPVEPNATSLLIFQRFRSTVIAIAKKYSIDPVLLLAVIVTEHTLNVGIKDVWENILVNTPLAPNGRFLGIGFSYGFGQIYGAAAEHAEPVVAAQENRPPQKSAEQFRDRLMTMEGALTYAAAILLDAQQTYKSYGFDISKNPGIQATLYNLGDFHKWAKISVNEKRDPKVNFFGWFVLVNWTKFYQILYDQSASTKLTPVGLEQSKIKNPLGEDLYSVFNMTKSAPLFLRPERCASYGSYDWSSNYNSGPLVTTHEKISRSETGTGPFEILQQALDCQGKEWSLIRMVNGAVGWASHNEIENSVGFEYKKRICESEPKTTSCLDKANLPDPRITILSQNDEERTIDIALLSYDPNKKPSTRNYQAACADEKYRQRTKEEQQRWNSTSNSFRSNYTLEDLKKSDEDKQRYEASLRDWMERTQEKYNYTPEAYDSGQRTHIREVFQAKRKEILEILGSKLSWEELRRQMYDFVKAVDNLEYDFNERCRDGACLGPPYARYEAEIAAIDIRRLFLDPVADLNSSNWNYPSRFFEVENWAFKAEKAKRRAALYDMSFDSQNQVIKESCQVLIDRFPEVRERFEKYMSDVESIRTPAEDFEIQRNTSNLEMLSVTCQALSAQITQQNRKIGEPLTLDKDTMLFNGAFSSVYLKTDIDEKSFSSSGVNIESLRYMHLNEKTILASTLYAFKTFIDDFDSRRKNYVEWKARSLKPDSGGYYWTECGYNPVATAELIGKISALPCVSMVQVPDEVNLIARIGLHNKKAVGVVGAEFNDRFRVVMKPRCDYAP